MNKKSTKQFNVVTTDGATVKTFKYLRSAEKFLDEAKKENPDLSITTKECEL